MRIRYNRSLAKVQCIGCDTIVDTSAIACSNCGTAIGYEGGTPVDRASSQAAENEAPLDLPIGASRTQAEAYTEDLPWLRGGFLSHHIEFGRTWVKYDGREQNQAPLSSSGYSYEFSVDEGHPSQDVKYVVHYRHNERHFIERDGKLIYEESLSGWKTRVYVNWHVLEVRQWYDRSPNPSLLGRVFGFLAEGPGLKATYDGETKAAISKGPDPKPESTEGHGWTA